MGETYDVAFCPHCPNGPISLFASIAMDAALPNFGIQEMSWAIHYNKGADLGTYLKNPDVLKVEDGFIKVPMTPGLGIEVDEEKVRANAKDAKHWSNLVWRGEDGGLREWVRCRVAIRWLCTRRHSTLTIPSRLNSDVRTEYCKSRACENKANAKMDTDDWVACRGARSRVYKKCLSSDNIVAGDSCRSRGGGRVKVVVVVMSDVSPKVKVKSDARVLMRDVSGMAKQEGYQRCVSDPRKTLDILEDERHIAQPKFRSQDVVVKLTKLRVGVVIPTNKADRVSSSFQDNRRCSVTYLLVSPYKRAGALTSCFPSRHLLHLNVSCVSHCVVSLNLKSCLKLSTEKCRSVSSAASTTQADKSCFEHL